MRKLVCKAMVEDVQNEKCTDAELENLLDIFEYTIKRIGLARKSCFHLEDFATARKRGVGRFTLTVERQRKNGRELFWGTFEYGSKKLKVLGTLED